MIKKVSREINVKQVKISDPFWSKRQELIIDTVIPYQEKILDDKIEGVEKSHAFANFRIAAGLEEGEFFGMVFQDSDVAKWLEALAYSLCIKPDTELEKRADEIIDIIAKAQQPDGYLNTYFTIKEPEKRWQNLHEGHELYCAGHMMEAAAAYYMATGKDKLINVMERMADYIGKYFVTEKREGIPGHQEIEIGLMRLYHVTGKEKFLKLALHFINERGKDPEFFIRETKKRGWIHGDIKDPYNTKYNQNYAPVREQKTAEGHSVRLVYMCTAMADLAAVTNDAELLKACGLIWDNIVNKRMYITGGIGSNAEGESFTIDYDLPNDSVYAETCASIGLMFFAREMLDACPSGKYSDVMELALYNGVLGGMQLDGKRFFYVNPLEVNPEISGKLFGFKHVLPERPGWYQCACCPPNVARLLASLGKYQWGEGENTIYSHLFIGGTAKLDLATIVVESALPWEGKVSYAINPTGKQSRFSLSVRIPSYAKNVKIWINGKEQKKNDIRDGYCYINRRWNEGDNVKLMFDMPVRRIYTNTMVRQNIGCVAIMRGPIVYCFEGIDNGGNIQELHINRGKEIKVGEYEPALLGGIVPLKIEGTRIFYHDSLYFEGEYSMKPEEITAIPYYAWGNRGLNQMRVWMHEI